MKPWQTVLCATGVAFLVGVTSHDVVYDTSVLLGGIGLGGAVAYSHAAQVLRRRGK